MTNNTIINEIKRLRAERAAIDKKIAELEERLLIQAAEPQQTQEVAEPQHTQEVAEPQHTQEVAEPQQTQEVELNIVGFYKFKSVNDFIDNIVTELEELETILLPRDYTKCRNSLLELMTEKYYDDIEDAMAYIYGILDKHIINSFVKVSNENRSKISNFLQTIGFTLIDIIGKRFADCIDYCGCGVTFKNEKEYDNHDDFIIKSAISNAYEIKYELENGDIQKLIFPSMYITCERP